VACRTRFGYLFRVGGDDGTKGKTLYPAGEVIDQYEIVRRVGYGSTSDVYEARDTTRASVVALKVLNHRRLRDPQARTRFQREASVHALIRHSNVVQIYGSGVTAAAEPYIVLELFSGRCLRTVLNQERTLPVERACSYMLQALDGLQACHAAGVRHRDLKPENMMLRPSEAPVEQVVLIDFGFAAFEGQKRLTAAGFVVGSLSYIAPERLAGDEGDMRADIYSMGVVLFELLTGSAPFEGEDLTVAHKHVTETPPVPSEVAPKAGITPELDAVVRNAMAKDPGERYQNVEAMAEALSRAVVPATPPEQLRSKPVPATLWYCDVDGVEKSVEAGERAILIGRAPECAVRTNDSLVSRQHAKLFWGPDGRYWIDDLDSTNGVWVGVDKVASAPVPFDEIVLVGSLVLELRPADTAPDERDLRPGIHTRLWMWLKAERKGRAAIERERNALGRRVGELHQAVEQMSQAEGVAGSPANAKLANELQLLRDSTRELRAAMVAGETEKAELASDLADARRSFSKALNKHTASLFSAQSENARLSEQIEADALELEDLRGRLSARDEQVTSLQQDLQGLSGLAVVGAQEETLALISAQHKAARLADRVAELEHAVDDQRRELATKRDEFDQRSTDEAAETADLNQQITTLSEELERLRWTQHQGHTGEVRLRLQLESALSEVGELRSKGTDTVTHNAESLSRLELRNAALDERVAELEGELENALTGARTSDDETVRLREQLLGARAEVEAAWAEVEHLRGESGGN